MKKAYVYHNLGLGDHIICNAIIRRVVKQFEMVWIFAKIHNAESVKFMYRDIKVKVLPVKDDAEVEIILSENMDTDRIRIGCTGPNWIAAGHESFDEVFYRQAGISFRERWDGFKYERNKYPFVTPKDKYIFVHQDKKRGYSIWPIHGKKLMTVEPVVGVTNNIFMWDEMISQAEEIHCINSSFMLLADSIPTKGKLFYHKYARNEGEFCNPKLRKDWTVIE